MPLLALAGGLLLFRIVCVAHGNGGMSRRRMTRIGWLGTVGCVLLTEVATGAVGIVTPGLPTTVFWIGAVVCFLKTRPHAVRPMLRTPVIGPAIRGFLRWRPFGRRKGASR